MCNAIVLTISSSSENKIILDDTKFYDPENPLRGQVPWNRPGSPDAEKTTPLIEDFAPILDSLSSQFQRVHFYSPIFIQVHAILRGKFRRCYNGQFRAALKRAIANFCNHHNSSKREIQSTNIYRILLQTLPICCIDEVIEFINDFGYL